MTAKAPATWVAIDKLIPWAANPRENDAAVAQVAKSIERFGWGAVILARRANGEIIAGHTRVRAAESLGLKKVPVRYLDISEDEAHALALADNKLGEIAAWSEGLMDVLRDLDGDVDLDGLGWSDDELADLLRPEPEPPAPPPPKLRPTPGAATLHVGDCWHVLREMDDNSVDAVVTDPPYGLSAPPDIAEVLGHWLAGREYKHGSPGFMGKAWDSFVPGPHIFAEIFRVLKPGGHLVCFAGTRTVDLMGISIRLAQFEIRDTLHWCYWEGFPKSRDISVDIDGIHGVEREVVGRRDTAKGLGGAENDFGLSALMSSTVDITAPATDDARRFAGYGTAVKPAVEPAILARKPISEKTVAANVLRWGTGGLNISATRFAQDDPAWPGPQNPSGWELSGRSKPKSGVIKFLDGVDLDPYDGGSGRFPANLVHFSKPSRAQREAGCEGLPTRTGADAVDRVPGSDGLNSPRAGAGRTAEGVHNWHPTVKPLGLMAWMVRLVGGQPGSVILDPFMGSGTTGAAAIPSGFDFVGVDLEEAHVDIARQRIAYWAEVGLAGVVYQTETAHTAHETAHETAHTAHETAHETAHDE